jgi:hypothetical protein
MAKGTTDHDNDGVMGGMKGVIPKRLRNQETDMPAKTEEAPKPVDENELRIRTTALELALRNGPTDPDGAVRTAEKFAEYLRAK